jgi:hypothetical protein
MNILFDLVATQPENSLKYHGGSEYSKAVFKAVSQKTLGRLYCIYDSDRHLDEDIKLFCVYNNLPLIDIASHKKLNTIIEKYNIERFYTALPLEKPIQKMLPVSSNIKSIITIHGLRSLELLSDKYELKYTNGLYYKIKYLYKRFLPVRYKTGLLFRIREMIKQYNNPTIITVSDYSKRSLKHFMPEIPESSIHVFYSPINDYFQEGNNDSFLLKNELESKKYFLLLSAGIWQKNSYRILTAFTNLIKNDLAKGYKFVIIGASEDIRKAFPHIMFIYIDYVERRDLEKLLRNAYALVYPSLNEGFGYPPLEALKYGTGVIASAIGPVMEVCGNAALFFNPYSHIEMKMKLVQSINDPAFVYGTQPRIDQYQKIRQRQMNDLNALVHIICD